MNAEDVVTRAFAWRDHFASSEFSRRLIGAVKIFFVCVVAAVAVFTALPRSRVGLVSADSDELLLTLAALASEGAATLCDPGRIERYLSIRIDTSGLTNARANDAPVAVSAVGPPISGKYWKFQAATDTVCRLQLQVAGRRFCDTDSARTQRLVGRRVQTLLPIPGEAGFYDHGYELVRNSKERSVIAWRQPSPSCPVNIEVAVRSVQ